MNAVDLFNRAGFAFLVFSLGFVLFYAVTGSALHGPLFFVAFTATAGWLYTAHVARRNQLEKNTYDLIQSYVRDARFVALRDTVWSHHGFYKRIDRAAAIAIVDAMFDDAGYLNKTSDKFPVGHHLTQIANFYEYLAIGLSNDFLAEEPAKRYFASTLRTFYSVKAQHVIAVLRERSRVPGGVVRRPPYDEMLELLRRWHPDLNFAAEGAVA